MPNVRLYLCGRTMVLVDGKRVRVRVWDAQTEKSKEVPSDYVATCGLLELCGQDTSQEKAIASLETVLATFIGAYTERDMVPPELLAPRCRRKEVPSGVADRFYAADNFPPELR